MTSANFSVFVLRKEGWKSTFRQYGQMEKQRWEESQERKEQEKNQRRERVRRKKVQVREKLRNTAFFPMFCGSGDGGSKSRFAKAVGAKPSGDEI